MLETKYVIADINLSKEEVEIKKISPTSDFSSLDSFEVVLQEYGDMWKTSPNPFLAISTGPLTGTGAPGTATYYVSCVTPFADKLTVNLCEGEIGPNLRYAGINHLALHGKATKPLIVIINEEGIELKTIPKIENMDIVETTNFLRQQLGEDIVIACIGSTDKASSPFASVVCDYYSEIKTPGLGRLFFELGLKALVVSGKNGVSFNSPDNFLEEIIAIYQHCVDTKRPNTKMGALVRSTYLSPWNKNTYTELPLETGYLANVKYLSSPIMHQALRHGISQEFLNEFILSAELEAVEDLELVLKSMENWKPVIPETLAISAIQATGLFWDNYFPFPDAIDYAAKLLKYYSGKEWNSFRLEEAGRRIENIYGEIVRGWQND